MKRRLILQGNKSATVTLPIAWVKKNSLSAGDEIDVSEKENKIVVSNEAKDIRKETEITLSGEFKKYIKIVLSVLYRQGYTKIKINLTSKNQDQLISQIIDDGYLGFEIVEKEKDKCILEVISEPTMEKFEVLMKKMFFIIEESAIIFAEDTSKGYYENQKQIENLTNKLRKYDNFCRRYIVNKMSGVLAFEYYSLLIHLLHLQTDLNRTYELLADAKRRLKESDRKVMQNVLLQYKKLYLLFFKKDFRNFSLETENVYSMMLGINKKAKNNFAYYCGIALFLRVLYSATVSMTGIMLYKGEELK